MAIKIRGIDGIKKGELEFEVQRGAKFVHFQYCISIIVLTFRRASDIYFIRQGENALVKGLPFTVLSLVAGWWGIPWGPIYTIQSVYNNSCGGKHPKGPRPGVWPFAGPCLPNSRCAGWRRRDLRRINRREKGPRLSDPRARRRLSREKNARALPKFP